MPTVPVPRPCDWDGTYDGLSVEPFASTPSIRC
jgi:hypothetical protein